MTYTPQIGDRVIFKDVLGYGPYLSIADGTTGTVEQPVALCGILVRWDDGRTISVWAECLKRL